MPKYEIYIDACATLTLEVDASNPEKAIEKGEKYILNEDLFDTFREKCDFHEPSVSSIVYDLEKKEFVD